MTGPLKRGRGRPKSSKKFRLVPVPPSEPDYRKIGRAFLALAIHQLESTTESTHSGGGDE